MLARRAANVGHLPGEPGLRWDALACWGEFALDVLPAVLRETGLPGPELDVPVVREKPLMRERLSTAGLAQPRYQLCQDLNEALAFQHRLGGRMIVKPSNFTGSACIRLVGSACETVSACADIARL